jgi:group I intron endonuclease
MSRCGVYAITHVATGRMYVGKSIDIDSRWQQHVWEAARGEGYAVHRAIRKHGVAAFSFDVLEYADSEIDALAAEQYWIEWYRSVSPAGFNLTFGGDGTILSQESREKIRAKLLGHHVSDETREKIRSANRGRVQSEQAREKVSAFWRGKTRGPRSAETKEKLRAAQTGKKLSDEVRAKMRASQAARWAKQKARSS